MQSQMKKRRLHELNTTDEFTSNVQRSSTPESSDRQTDKPKEQNKKRKHSDLSLDEPISKFKYKQAGAELCQAQISLIG